MATMCVDPTGPTGPTAPVSLLLQVEERERGALAAHLHDGPIQGVVAIRLMAELASSALRRGETDSASQRLGEVVEATRQALQTSRDTMRRLHGRCLDGTGLTEAIATHVQAATSDGALTVEVKGSWDAPLPPAVAIAAHRVVEAGLADARTRHAKTMNVDVSPAKEGIRVALTDDAAIRSDAGDSDLNRWASRVELLGGDLVVSATAKGQLVTCWLPLDTSVIGGPVS